MNCLCDEDNLLFSSYLCQPDCVEPSRISLEFNTTDYGYAYVERYAYPGHANVYQIRLKSVRTVNVLMIKNAFRIDGVVMKQKFSLSVSREFCEYERANFHAVRYQSI